MMTKTKKAGNYIPSIENMTGIIEEQERAIHILTRQQLTDLLRDNPERRNSSDLGDAESLKTYFNDSEEDSSYNPDIVSISRDYAIEVDSEIEGIEEEYGFPYPEDITDFY